MHLFLEVNLRFSDYCKTTGLFQDPLATQPLDIDVMHCGSHTSRVSFMCPTCALRCGLPDWLDDRFTAGGIRAVYRMLGPLSCGAYRVPVLLNQHHRCRARIRKPTRPLWDIQSKTKRVDLVGCRRRPMEQ